MSITISNYSFARTFKSPEPLKNQGGVYAILTSTNNGKNSLLDVGESGSVKERV